MTELYKYVTCMDKFFLIRKNTYNLKTFNAFDASISTNKKACCKSATRTPGPWYPVTQDSETPSKFKSGTSISPKRVGF